MFARAFRSSKLICSNISSRSFTLSSASLSPSSVSRLSGFTNFHVPQELIAQSPANPRDSSRLMVVRRQTQSIEHHTFRDLPDILDDSYLIVANNSKVVNCKLTARLGASGGTQKLVLYLLKQTGPSKWIISGDEALETIAVGSDLLIKSQDQPNSMRPAGEGHSQIIGKLTHRATDGAMEMDFKFETSSSLAAAGYASSVPQYLHDIAAVPLPPYISAEHASKVSAESYQTVYAREDGSVAAPTAGLHFTPEVFQRLRDKGITREEITLHVGYGTFGHVVEDDLSKHQMHSEAYTIPQRVADAVNTHLQLNPKRNKILTVGTTSTRVLETCASKAIDPILNRRKLNPGSGETNIFIFPPYEFKMIDALLTNFHVPGLTPIMLVSSFAGYDLTMKAYEEAIKEKYRFFSFGDSMLIL